MAYILNNDKMLQAVLMNESLMKVGNYTLAEISTIYSALDSDNPVINVVAQITLKGLHDYLKRNI